jgi:hypothetical protein
VSYPGGCTGHSAYALPRLPELSEAPCLFPFVCMVLNCCVTQLFIYN